MTRIKVWDPAIRLFHWSLVAGFAANALLVDPESDLHLWIGYAILALVGLRLVWGVVGPRFARFASFPPSLGGALEQVQEVALRRRHVHLGHSPLGALMIYNLIIALLLIGLSGWMMTTDRYWGIEWVEEFHEAAVTWAEISVVVHVLAVLVESARLGVNLPRAMVTGVKTLPDGARYDP